MAVLTASGITFSNSTQLNSKYGIYPQSTALVFWQTNAPTGWVKVTSQNDKALRVVSGAAANTGGTNTFSGTMASRPVAANVPVTITGISGGNATLDTNTIPAHAHPANAGGNVNAAGGGNARVANSGNTGNFGNSGAHAHPITVNAANGPISTNVDFAVQYIDVIYCTFS